ncbi:MAG: TetR/AcrR family transcriptional regulator [Treponema sp.]|nr:TetR/AcrR family transcriptional regulator [Treponema sp.]
MAIVVEHEKRKQEILQKSLDVFIDEGYEDVTFQKIADRCGITRTTLYIYFRNKNEIFLWSIKQLLTGVELAIEEILNDSSNNAEATLRKTLDVVIEAIQENRKLFHVLQIYLIQLEKSGESANDRVNHRVIRIRHVLNHILIMGIKNNEFKDLNVRNMNEALYSLIESAIFRVTVLGQKNIEMVKESIKLAIDGFLTDK